MQIALTCWLNQTSETCCGALFKASSVNRHMTVVFCDTSGHLAQALNVRYHWPIFSCIWVC